AVVGDIVQTRLLGIAVPPTILLPPAPNARQACRRSRPASGRRPPPAARTVPAPRRLELRLHTADDGAPAGGGLGLDREVVAVGLARSLAVVVLAREDVLAGLDGLALPERPPEHQVAVLLEDLRRMEVVVGGGP